MTVVVSQISISAILAAVDWRAAKAEAQRRDRKGRFAEMGGGFSFNFALPGGGSQQVTGKIVGVSGTEDVNVEIKGYDGIQDGIYAVPSKSGENVKAVININPSAIPETPETSKLSPQLTPTDDVAEAKATGRPLRALQRGSFPPKVQEAFDEVEKVMKSWGDPGDPGEKKVGTRWNDLYGAISDEYGKLGFTSEETEIVKKSFVGVLTDIGQQALLKSGMENNKPGSFDEKYGDDRKLQTAKDALVDARIAVAVDADVLDKVLESGRFKSQFETKTSKGTLSFEQRSENDTGQLGYHPSVDPAKRPIFGYVTTNGEITDTMLNTVRQYGQVQFVMKKDIEARSTYTTQDSLSYPAMVPAPFGVPSADAGRDPANEYIYAEAQMHGGVSLEDVDYAVVRVGSTMPEMQVQGTALTEEQYAAVSESLTKSNIRVIRVDDGQSFDVRTGQVVDSKLTEKQVERRALDLEDSVV